MTIEKPQKVTLDNLWVYASMILFGLVEPQVEKNYKFQIK